MKARLDFCFCVEGAVTNPIGESLSGTTGLNSAEGVAWKKAPCCCGCCAVPVVPAVGDEVANPGEEEEVGRGVSDAEGPATAAAFAADSPAFAFNLGSKR